MPESRNHVFKNQGVCEALWSSHIFLNMLLPLGKKHLRLQECGTLAAREIQTLMEQYPPSLSHDLPEGSLLKTLLKKLSDCMAQLDTLPMDAYGKLTLCIHWHLRDLATNIEEPEQQLAASR